jgi:hypothetical protein
MGTTQWAVSMFERGLRHAGDADMLRRYCRAIGCDPRAIDPNLVPEATDRTRRC